MTVYGNNNKLGLAGLPHQVLLIGNCVCPSSHRLGVDADESFPGVLRRAFRDSFWSQRCRVVEGQVGVACERNGTLSENSCISSKWTCSGQGGVSDCCHVGSILVRHQDHLRWLTVIMMSMARMVVMVVMNQGQVILVLVPYPWDSKITNDNNMTVIENMEFEFF